ncbi:hypothetical protein KF707_20185 [Candidatus Obscuribacterales bacterium]|nr:hypothetical protein [Candidatus Obscuribacterales bacterium]
MNRRSKIRICTSLILFCIFTLGTVQSAHAGLFSLFHRKRSYLNEPHAIARGGLVTPPGEANTFPVRDDGQDFILNVDTTVNLTTALNKFYYDPKWRGEVWQPFDQVTLIERQTRLMSTWKEYDEFSELRKFNIIHKFFERASGFGP